MPTPVSERATSAATAAATMPRGATQATKARSRQVRSEPDVESQTFAGRTTRISAATVAIPAQPRSVTCSTRTLAASSMNSMPTSITVSWSLNSRRSRSPRMRRLPTTTPATVTARIPLWEATCSQPSNKSSTEARTKMFSCPSGTRRRTASSRDSTNPPATPATVPKPMSLSERR